MIVIAFRTVYVAGINRKHLAVAAAGVPYWLLSATLLRRYPGWVEQYMTRRRLVRWDPGTFSVDAICYKTYRLFLHEHAKPWHSYLQYDEIGDAEATEWYLKDMRRRGMKPIPIMQGGAFHMLEQESHIAIGGLVPMGKHKRREYLDEIFIHRKAQCKIHLLGMVQPEWYVPYERAREGDNTGWIQRAPWNRKRSIEEWFAGFYGRQFIRVVESDS